VVRGIATFADDPEGVVFHYRGAADAAEEALLHAALEADDCHFGRRLGMLVELRPGKEVAYDFDFDGDLAEGDPGDEDTGGCE
jgi:hypothetical protein